MQKQLGPACIQAGAQWSHGVKVHPLLTECGPLDAASLAVHGRVYMNTQVSWCKLEVELASPKAVAAGTAELAKRDAPPLVVAALNLKTVLQAKVRLRQHSGQQHCCGCHETAGTGD